jgi:eukaryotic-like serine/threonine-protein kinase
VAAAAAGLPHLFHTSAKTESESPAQTAAAAPVVAPPTAAPQTAAQTPEQPAPDSTPAAPTKSVDVPAPPVQKGPKPPRPVYIPNGPTGGGTQPEVTTQPANVGPSAEEVEQAHEQKVQLDARAGSVSTSLENLKRQQEADGLGLRQDMAGAYARMNSYLRLANDNLASGNIAAARTYMDKADKEISTLESFFGK